MGSKNHFLGPYFPFRKVVVISLMGNENHFLDPYFSFTKVVVISLMGSKNPSNLLPLPVKLLTTTFVKEK